MKAELNRERIPWSIVNRGIHENERYNHVDGAVYQFKSVGKRIRNSNLTNTVDAAKPFSRTEFIEFLSHHLHEIILLKLQISDQRLRQYQLSAKALGDDLYFLTESFHKQNNLSHHKYWMTDFITSDALYILQHKKSARLVFEHMVPKNIYLKPLAKQALEDSLTYTDIYHVLMKYYYTCTVTLEEDQHLPSTNMQDGWDGQNPFYRYQLAGIDFIENPKSYS